MLAYEVHGDDALAVLDAAGHDTAHVFGVSMGGMIAQHLALDHRERVRSLILGCTTAGGRRGAPPWRLMTATALRPIVGAARTFPIVAPVLYAERTRRERPERVREDLRIRTEDSTDIRTTLAQMAAIARHDTRARLGELAGLDVTVIHGEEDVLVPSEAGRGLAAAIPGARLVMIPACGHMLTTDAEDEAAGAVLGHLARASSGSRAPVVVKDADGDVRGGALDLERVSVGRSPDGRLRASMTMKAPWSPRDLLAGAGEAPGTLCLRVWLGGKKPSASVPDYLVCATVAADNDKLKASVL